MREKELVVGGRAQHGQLLKHGQGTFLHQQAGGRQMRHQVDHRGGLGAPLPQGHANGPGRESLRPPAHDGGRHGFGGGNRAEQASITSARWLRRPVSSMACRPVKAGAESCFPEFRGRWPGFRRWCAWRRAAHPAGRALVYLQQQAKQALRALAQLLAQGGAQLRIGRCMPCSNCWARRISSSMSCWKERRIAGHGGIAVSARSAAARACRLGFRLSPAAPAGRRAWPGGRTPGPGPEAARVRFLRQRGLEQQQHGHPNSYQAGHGTASAPFLRREFSIRLIMSGCPALRRPPARRPAPGRARRCAGR